VSRKFFYIIALVFILPVVAMTWLAYDIQQFMSTQMSIPEQGVVVKVEAGSHLTRIAKQLHRSKIISNPRYLVWYARWTQQTKKVHIGEYKLKQGDTPEIFLSHIAKGNVIQYSMTLVEGWSFAQVLEALNNNINVKHTLTDTDYPSVMTALGYDNVHPEGRFMPDTYHFPQGEKDRKILQRAYRSMEKYLARKWDDRDVNIPINDSYQALILASIVEKETGLAAERPTIAGVFSRRLILGMRLQSDPTIIYGMGKSYKGNIRRSDINRKTAYNTYRINGLPPTPIAMPGRAAIDAVLHPKEGRSLYFVATGRNGSHYFSATLHEHNQAVIKYQLKGRKKSFSSYKSSKH